MENLRRRRHKEENYRDEDKLQLKIDRMFIFSLELTFSIILNFQKQDSNFIIVLKGKLSLIENKFTDKQDEGMNCLIYNFKIR